MTTHRRKSPWLAPALLSLAAVAGCCCQAVPLPDEYCCPTDARRMYFAYGEEAVRRCPLGPDREFFGLKPTCWREWPEGWQCNGCVGMPYQDHTLCGDAVAEAPVTQCSPVTAPARDPASASNLSRPDSGASELPLPPRAAEFAPTRSAPASPSPPDLTMPPALEKATRQTQPTAPPSSTSPRAMRKSELKNLFAKQVSAELPVARALALTPPANAPADQGAAISSPLATTGPILNQPKLLPLIEDAQPIARKEISHQWQPPKYIPSVVTTTALIKVEQPPAKVAPARHLERDPSMSNRVQEHLMKNLQL